MVRGAQYYCSGCGKRIGNWIVTDEVTGARLHLCIHCVWKKRERYTVRAVYKVDRTYKRRKL